MHGDVLHVQYHLARLCGLFIDLKLDIAADHHAGGLLLGGVLDIHGSHILALAQDGAAVGDRHDLVELVGNKEDGLASFLNPRMISISSSISCGVSTAVGSSKMRISLSR